MDITDVVVQTLNARYPSRDPDPIVPTGGTSSTAPPPLPGK